MKTVKEKIRDREPVFGTMISEMACPNLARIFKAAGFAYMIAVSYTHLTLPTTSRV